MMELRSIMCNSQRMNKNTLNNKKKKLSSLAAGYLKGRTVDLGKQSQPGACPWYLEVLCIHGEEGPAGTQQDSCEQPGELREDV